MTLSLKSFSSLSVSLSSYTTSFAQAPGLCTGMLIWLGIIARASWAEELKLLRSCPLILHRGQRKTKLCLLSLQSTTATPRWDCVADKMFSVTREGKSQLEAARVNHGKGAHLNCLSWLRTTSTGGNSQKLRCLAFFVLSARGRHRSQQRNRNDTPFGPLYQGFHVSRVRPPLYSA